LTESADVGAGARCGGGHGDVPSTKEYTPCLGETVSSASSNTGNYGWRVLKRLPGVC